MPEAKTTGTLETREPKPPTTQTAAKPVETTPSTALLPIDKAPEHATLETVPRVLNGAEVAAIALFRGAEQLAMVLSGNSQFSEIVAMQGAKISMKLELRAESVTPTGSARASEVSVTTPMITIDTAAHPNMPDLLRVEAGLGLWHRVGQPDGRFYHIQAPPMKKVMEHLLRIAGELGKVSGFKAGVNKE